MIQLDSHIEIEWAGEKRFFKLKLGEVRAIETTTGLGLQRLYKDALAGDWKVDHVREIIRQGLIGGGMAILDADALLKINFDEKPLLQHVSYANAILGAVLIGQENEKLDDEPAKKKTQRRKRVTAASPGRSSTGTPAKSASPQGKSTNSRTGNGRRSQKPTAQKPVEKKPSKPQAQAN